ncbi:Z1 domain-containing protein [Streptomyces sp. NBC_00878]|uniref:Z1 domain-containing protein n=1 Tax=Streptomyces sp. NBC_00878 TaxID=2975854 RepID=UPI00225BBEFE|nr:Z1 domain-containing protein [Streptomyces sp. NBC_00878]MCX4908404.1 Z1 domain-containing protein [Streptomyces sp. NBC_00878]
MHDRPRHFAKWAAEFADEDYPGTDLSDTVFLRLLACGDEALKGVWSRALSAWDFDEHPAWSPETPARSDERRAAVYARLCFDGEVRAALNLAVPVPKTPGPTIVTREFTPWYTLERATTRSFYWAAYEQVLRRKGWSDAAVASLHEASRAVVERLTDPEQSTARQAKGLVVGYVQSGKTANFTGVAAKAIDAGYRLVIVLSGTLNLLRAQTQRRIDMELIGQENILRGANASDVDTLVGIDYVGDDEDWPKFVQYGARPSALGAFDIERLTTRDSDYKSLAQGIRALEFEKREPVAPLHDPRNLHHSAARMLVVKKNKAVLTKLVKDLKQIHGLLDQLPVLIIDDESDQASVNTTDPKKWDSGRPTRTAINGLISQLLGLLPRAQYVGYTATPFANVFVDPSDSEDIFPTDFLISLPRPSGYMGVQDFHDLDSEIPYQERDFATSREKAHVRSVYESTGDRLQEAMDAFVLTGALKLYRADRGAPEGHFRHHTMLVHESVRMDDHAALALRLNSMWHEAGYSSTAGHARLATLFDRDFAPVSRALAGTENDTSDGALPLPSAFHELRPYVGRARQLIGKNGNPVIVVNGDTDRYFDQLDLDFDRNPNVWKILVGGTKLSRGFTVEGLTITYYRRTTRQADTLMQMGRWFGFRPSYRDLVRLYIGREEALTKSQSADLYEAFEAVCRDEENFREQLSRYSVMVDGKPQLTPAKVPPLVAQHLPWVKPSARNKMFNAELVEVRSPGEWVEPKAYPEAGTELRQNAKVWLPVLTSLSERPVPFVHLNPRDRGNYTQYSAKTCVIPHSQLLDIMAGLIWDRPDLFTPHLNFLRDPDCATNDWLVIAPQTSSRDSVSASILGSEPLSLVRRTRLAHGPFNRITGLAHRQSAERVAGKLQLVEDDPYATEFHQPRRGAVLLYPVVSTDLGTPASLVANGQISPNKVVIAAAFIPATDPHAKPGPLVRFRTIDKSREDEAVIDAP